MKIKHSKYKNTGILFELLVRQITSDTLEGKDSPIKSLLKKYFVKETGELVFINDAVIYLTGDATLKDENSFFEYEAIALDMILMKLNRTIYWILHL